MGLRMRALFVTPFFEPAWALGGVATSPAAWARALAAQGIEVEVFTTTANAGRELDVTPNIPIDRDGLKVTYFPRWRWSGNRFISLPLARACARRIIDFDLIHAVGLWTFPSWVGCLAAQRAGIPYIVSLHGMLMGWARQRHQRRKAFFMMLSERRHLSVAQVVICSSELEERHFRQTGLRTKTVVIPNVVYAPNIAVGESRSRFRDRHNLQDADICLFAGRLVENKGIHLTVEAFAAAAERYPKAHLVIVGPLEDHSGQAARRQAQRLNLGDRVRFLGLLSGNDYWDAVAGADLFVLNSYSENFAVAPAEALAIGVPVLLSDQVGIADWVSQYRAGVIVPLEVGATAEAIVAMLARKDLLREMGRNGVRLVQDQFSPDGVGKRFAALLEDVEREYRRPDRI